MMMTKKFKNKYRISSTRAPFWDYGWNAAYFVTICTHNRECWFGKIVDGVVELSDIGNIVKSEWLKTFEMRPDMNLSMGEYVVMPNHFHAIIGIGKNKYNSKCGGDGGDDIDDDNIGKDAMHCVYVQWNAKPYQKQIWATIQKFDIHYSWVQNWGHQKCTIDSSRICMATPLS